MIPDSGYNGGKEYGEIKYRKCNKGIAFYFQTVKKNVGGDEHGTCVVGKA